MAGIIVNDGSRRDPAVSEQVVRAGGPANNLAMGGAPPAGTLGGIVSSALESLPGLAGPAPDMSAGSAPREPKQYSDMSHEELSREALDRARARSITDFSVPENVAEGVMKGGMMAMPGGGLVGLLSRGVQAITERDFERAMRVAANQVTAGMVDSDGQPIGGYDPDPRPTDDWGPRDYGGTYDENGRYNVGSYHEPGGGGGGGGGTVICTLMHERGLIDKLTLLADEDFVRERVSAATYRGYFAMAVPVVRGMRRWPWLFSLIAFFAVRWAREMEAQVWDIPQRGSFIGRVVMWIGVPLCWTVGTINRRRLTLKEILS